MTNPIPLVILILIMAGCISNPDQNEQFSLVTKSETLVKQKDSIFPQQENLTIEKIDSVNMKSSTDSKPTKKPKSKMKMKDIGLVRYVDFPGDNHFNGKPLVIQVDLSEKKYNTNIDTVKQIAKSYYQLSEPSFPVAIADNFEEGISTEIRYYPRLTYELQLFENEMKTKPYAVIIVVVKREKDGNYTVVKQN